MDWVDVGGFCFVGVGYDVGYVVEVLEVDDLGCQVGYLDFVDPRY